jgi:hypothetical protein
MKFGPYTDNDGSRESLVIVEVVGFPEQIPTAGELAMYVSLSFPSIPPLRICVDCCLSRAIESSAFRKSAASSVSRRAG